MPIRPPFACYRPVRVPWGRGKTTLLNRVLNNLFISRTGGALAAIVPMICQRSISTADLSARRNRGALAHGMRRWSGDVEWGGGLHLLAPFAIDLLQGRWRTLGPPEGADFDYLLIESTGILRTLARGPRTF